MPEEKSSVTMATLLLWLPALFTIGSWIFILGSKDKSVEVLQVQVNEQRDEHKDMWKQIRENLSAIIDQKAKLEYMQRELEQERVVREQRK